MDSFPVFRNEQCFFLNYISFLNLKNAILSVLYRFLRAPKDMVRCFLVVVIFLPSRETPVKPRKIWDKYDDILLVLTIIALWATKETPC